MTLALLAEDFIELATHGRRFSGTRGLSGLYLTLLSAYAVDKEAGRWAGGASEAETLKRKGEWFIVAWAGAAFAMISAAGYAPDHWSEPHDLMFVTKGVVAVFLGGQVSKRWRKWLHRKDPGPTGI